LFLACLKLLGDCRIVADHLFLARLELLDAGPELLDVLLRGGKIAPRRLEQQLRLPGRFGGRLGRWRRQLSLTHFWRQAKRVGHIRSRLVSQKRSLRRSRLTNHRQTALASPEEVGEESEGEEGQKLRLVR
jgi:hypothetical protein